MQNQTRIIGIDPGTRYTGIGIIDRIDNRLKFVFSETIVTIQHKAIEDRLMTIFCRLGQIIDQYRPQTAAIEKIFHSINPRSSLLLGHARGVAMLAIRLKEVTISEYAPNQIKSAIVGVGRASKDQVGAMVRILLNLDRHEILKEDEADALAAAICHANTTDFAAYG